MNIKDELARLKESDIYSLMAFALYKAKSKPELSPISELPYLLSLEDMLRLCGYFGGLTITIPTIEEFEEFTYALLAYQRVKIDNEDKDKVFKEISDQFPRMASFERYYDCICEVLRAGEESQ